MYRILDSLPKDVVSEDRIEEWAYQAYESLAPDEMYQIDVRIVDVVNYKAPIPRDANNILMILYKSSDAEGMYGGTNDRFSTSADSYKEINTYKDLNTGDQVHVETTTNINIGIDRSKPVYKADHNGAQRAEELYRFISQQAQSTWKPLPISTNVFHGVNSDDRLRELYQQCKHSFSLQDGCIVTSFPFGKLAVAYKGIPKNESGDYLMPDIETVKRAIETYVFKKYWQWQMNMREDGAYNLYNLYSREYEFASAKATAELMMPDLIDYQDLRNLNKFIKEDSPFSIALGALGNREVVDFRDPRRSFHPVLSRFTNFDIHKNYL